MRKIIIFPGGFILKCLNEQKANLVEMFKKLALRRVTVIFISNDIKTVSTAVMTADLEYREAFFISYRVKNSKSKGSFDVKDLKIALDAADSSRGTLISHLPEDALAAEEAKLNFILFKDNAEKEVDRNNSLSYSVRSNSLSYSVLKDLSLLPAICS